MATYQYLTDGRPDGAVIGQTTSEPLGFYGSTPVNQQTGFAAIDTTVSLSTTTEANTSWGFSTSTQANAILTDINLIRTALVNLGFITAS